MYVKAELLQFVFWGGICMLISVIVPVYNVKDYLAKCIESIINQTYKMLDIVLVDDGSTDGSGEICMRYAAKEPRIRYFAKKKNQGLSAARNYGIEKAYGDVIAFVDSDDYIEPEMYEKMASRMEEFSADIVACNFNRVRNQISEKGKVRCCETEELRVFSGDEIDSLLYEEYIVCVAAWNKLYKKAIFDNIRYPVGKKFEDNFVVHEILNAVMKVVVLEEALYNYVYREGSIMNGRTYLANLDEIEAVDSRVQFYKANNKGNQLIKSAVCESIRKRVTLYWYLVKQVHLRSDDRKRKIIKECKKIIKENKDILQSDYPCEFKIFIYSPTLGSMISHIRLKR